MFEAENDIERLLMRASAEPAERPGFARALIDAQIFVVLVVRRRSDRPRTRRQRPRSPEGTKLDAAERDARRGEADPVLHARRRGRAPGSRTITSSRRTRTRDLFARYPHAPFLLNPGSDYGKEFTPAEVKRLLAGQFDDGPRTVVAETSQQVLLGASQRDPRRLDRGAGRASLTPSKPSRRLADAGDACPQRRQSWMLGVDHTGAWQDVQDAIGRALAGDVLEGRILDALPLERQFARLHSTYRNSRHRRQARLPPAALQVNSNVQTQSSHFRRAVSRRRADLQGSRRRGRLPAQSRQGQGQARRDHRQLRRPCDPLRDQGDGEDHRQGHQAEGDRPRRHRRRQCRDSRRRPPRASS